MFSINEEIDFSDDDLDLSILNLPANKSVKPSSSKQEHYSSIIKRPQKEIEKTSSSNCNASTTPKPTPKRFKFTKTEDKNSNKRNYETSSKQNIETQRNTSCIDLPDDFFDIDNDKDDDFFSQLDFPKNDKKKTTLDTDKNRNMSTTPIA